MFAVKAGSVTVLLAGDRVGGRDRAAAAAAVGVPRAPTSLDSSVSPNGVRRLFSRYLRLGIGLTVVYASSRGAISRSCSAPTRARR